MAKGHAAIAMPTALREALREVLAFPTADDTQKTAKSEIIKALQKAARRQRIVISQTTISWVRWFGLLVTGLCVMIGMPLLISTIVGIVVLHSRYSRRVWQHPS